ncbi:MAG: DcaP family trimeric outer membrane transporter [Sulfurimonas sp.]
MTILRLFYPLILSVLLLAADEAQNDSNATSPNFLDKTIFSVGGRVHISTIFTSDQSSYFAGKIALDSKEKEEDIYANARESRLWTKTRTPTEQGILRTTLEIDFLGTKDGKADKNDYYPRLRHAFVELGSFGFGQTNSTFNSVSALDTISYPMDDTFVRQSLLRYTYDKDMFAFDISLEDPKTTLLDSSSSKIITKDDLLFDLVMRARYYPLWGEVGIAFLSRKITHNSSIHDTKDSKYGYGINLSGRLKTFAMDDIRFNIHYGEGSGRYIAYGAFSEGVIDSDGDISLTPLYGGHLGYRHWWSPKLRSTIAFSYVGADNNLDVLQTGLDKVTKESYGTQANLLWVPVKNLLTGLEYAWAKREVESKESGSTNFLNLILRYDF